MLKCEPLLIKAHDQQSKEKLASILAQQIYLVEQAQTTIVDTLSLAEIVHSKRTLSQELSTNLLVRVHNELYAVKMLCAAGYSLQAFAIAATIYEIVMVGIYYGSSQKLAKIWFSHWENKPIERIDKLTKLASAVLEEKENKAWSAKEYGNYKLFCLGKHSNPKLQMSQGLVYDNTGKQTESFHFGSSADEFDILKSRIIMIGSVGYTILALTAFLKQHVRQPDKQKQIQALIDDLIEQHRINNELASRR